MAQYFTVKHEDYINRLGDLQIFDLATAPCLSERSALDELALWFRRGVVAEIVPVPASILAARQAKAIAATR